LHKHRTDLSAHNRAGRAELQATRFFAMFANVGEKIQWNGSSIAIVIA
jgi:hypothetical protein